MEQIALKTHNLFLWKESSIVTLDLGTRSTGRSCRRGAQHRAGVPDPEN